MTAPAPERLRWAADALRRTIATATPGPWHIAGGKYRALASSKKHPDRPCSGGWGWEEEYGGYLVAESLMSSDLLYLATMNPLVGAAVATWLENADPGDLHAHAVADLIIN